MLLPAKRRLLRHIALLGKTSVRQTSSRTATVAQSPITALRNRELTHTSPFLIMLPANQSSHPPAAAQYSPADMRVAAGRIQHCCKSHSRLHTSLSIQPSSVLSRTMTVHCLASSSAQQTATLATSLETVAVRQPPRVLDSSTGPAVLQQLDTLMFDQDGVLWRGHDLIPNAVEALHAFRAAGKRLLFVTNNSSKSRQEYVAKFQSLGVDVAADEIVSSSYTAAAYLDSTVYKQQRLAAGQAPCVLLMGSSGMRVELEAVGLQVVDGEELQLPLMDNVQDMTDMQLDPRIGAVVLGWDARFTYSKLVYATALIREQGCLFIATNLDHADAISSSSSSNGTSAVGRVMPGTGSLVAAVQVASGVTPINVGKGGDWLFDHLMQRYHIQPSRTAMIGDRLDTDIAMGKQGGLMTLLPLTGVTTLQEALAAPPGAAPDYIIDSVASLAGL